MTATAHDLAERIRTEGDKQLHRLDALAHPQRTRAKAKRRRVGMLTLFVLGIGVAYSVIRSLRQEKSTDELRFADRDMPAREDAPARDQRFATAGL